MKRIEDKIRGRIAENIVSEMLGEAGYFVYRFGYEGLLQSLVQKGLPKMREGDIEADKVRNMPDFIVMNPEGDVSFIEVKFRTNRDSYPYLREDMRRTAKYWPEAKIIIVHPSEPHFMVSSIPSFMRTGRLYRLETDKFIRVKHELILKYGELVKRFLGK